MIKAVLFDCDGLMFETELVAQGIWRFEAQKRGIVLPEDFFVHITGTSGPGEEAYLASIPGMKKARKEIGKLRFDLDFWRSIHTDCLNKKGLITLYRYLKDNDYKMAICSSSGREYVETLLSTVSVNMAFDAIVGGDMVSHSKPDPEIFLLGAEKCGVQPCECLVLEDSKWGILAAGRAGMRSCFIEDTIVPDEEMMRFIDLKAYSLDDVCGLLEKLCKGDA